MLTQLVYTSSATRPFERGDLADILRSSRRRNAAAGVTGVLLYTEGRVMQALEGPQEAVEATFARIRADRRHRAITTLHRSSVAGRSFPDWAMGLSDPVALADEDLTGVRSLFEASRPGPERARCLLTLFRSSSRLALF